MGYCDNKGILGHFNKVEKPDPELQNQDDLIILAKKLIRDFPFPVKFECLLVT